MNRPPIYGDPTSFEEKRYSIYLHHNKINGKNYVGQTCLKPEKRWGGQGQGYKKQPRFWNAIQKYGWENFEHKILMEGLNQEEANQAEQYWIKFFNSNNSEHGYNLTSGSQGHNNLSAQGLEKKRESLRKYWASEEGRAQAKKHSLETMGKNNPMYGKHHSEESKKKISESHTGEKNGNYGKHFTQEHRSKISEANKGKHKHIGEKNPRAKAVFCIELNKCYLTAKSAAEETGADNSAIGKCCRGIRSYAGKDSKMGYLHWRYATEKEKRIAQGDRYE